MQKQLRTGSVIFFLLMTTIMYGQNKEITLQFFGGASIGVGEFAKKIGSPIEITRRSGFAYGPEVGLAATGFAFGAEITFPILVEGLGWQLSTKAIINPTNKEEIESRFNEDPLVLKALTFETGSWINIPIFSGFSYGIKVADDLNVYAHLQAGINFTQQASRKATYDGTVVEDTKYRMMPDFGMEAGISLELFDNYVLSARYLNLGSPRYEGTRTLNEKLFTEIPQREFKIEAEEKPVSMMLITIGIKI